MKKRLSARLAGLACVIGGLLFFLLNYQVFYLLTGVEVLSQPNGWQNLSETIAAVILSLCLTAGPIGLMVLGAAGTGWWKKFGICGVIWSLLGSASYIIGTIYLYKYPDDLTSQIFMPIGAISLAIGALKMGAAVLSARVLPGWQRFAPLLVGIYFFIQFAIQVIYFLGPEKGPNSYLLGTWGIFWTLLGAAVWTSADGRLPDNSHWQEA